MISWFRDDATETYEWADKKLTTVKTFPEIFIENRKVYEDSMTTFKILKSRYDKQRRYFRSVIKQPFASNLSEKFSHIIQNHRNEQMNVEFKYEISKNRDRVHDFTGILKENGDLNKILGKGPNFIPATGHNDGNVFRDITQNVINALCDYSHTITHTKAFTHDRNIALSLNLNHPNFDQHSLNYIYDILEGCSDIDNETLCNQPLNNNMSHEDSLKIKHLADNSNIIVNIADKNLGFSVNHVQWYVAEYKRQLSDTTVYEAKEYSKINEIITQGTNDLKTLYDKYHDDPGLIIYDLDILTTRSRDNIKLPTLNIIPKVHKLKSKASPHNEKELKGRPIVNGFATINTEPSKLLGEIFHCCLLQMVNAFKESNIRIPVVNSSMQVIERLRQMNLQSYNLDNIYFISFDFSSLYTAIKKWTVFDTIHFMGKILELEKAEILIMKELFTFIKTYAYFTVGNKLLYLQKEGFAMGSYDSVDGSNLVLLKSEYYMLQNPEISSCILDFFRYIDDGSMIVYIQHDKIREFTSKIASFYPRELEIEFTVTKFHTVFLDLTYGIGHETYQNGQIYYRIYQKPFNAYAYLDYSSNHPYGVFKGIINTECHRYKTHSCNEAEYTHLCKLFKNRLKKCRYPNAFIRKHILQYTNDKKGNTINKVERGAFCKVLFNKIQNQHLLYRKVLRSKRKIKCSKRIMICNKTRPKLKTILLTKKKLHSKLSAHL